MSGLTTTELNRHAANSKVVGAIRSHAVIQRSLLDALIAAARLQVALDELPLPEGWTLTSLHGGASWGAQAQPSPAYKSAQGTYGFTTTWLGVGATGATMLAAVLALGDALRSRI
jgi:hypothetical protein